MWCPILSLTLKRQPLDPPTVAETERTWDDTPPEASETIRPKPKQETVAETKASDAEISPEPASEIFKPDFTEANDASISTSIKESETVHYNLSSHPRKTELGVETTAKSWDDTSETLTEAFSEMPPSIALHKT